MERQATVEPVGVLIREIIHHRRESPKVSTSVDHGPISIDPNDTVGFNLPTNLLCG